MNTYCILEKTIKLIENNLYKYRKHLYETTAAVFSSVLTTAFPDIEYINISIKLISFEKSKNNSLTNGSPFKYPVSFIFLV